jgi:tRNA nucleotidyltransferase (CCA-adding enzyme)
LAIAFTHGKINANTLYSQLRKTAKQVVSELQETEFKVFKSSFWTNEADKSLILLELEVWSLPKMFHHKGPPITQDAANQERFNQKYEHDRPYVKDGRWVVDTPRKFTRAEEALKQITSSRRGFGKNLRDLEGTAILEDDALFDFDGEGWLRFLNDYLD